MRYLSAADFLFRPQLGSVRPGNTAGCDPHQTLVLGWFYLSLMCQQILAHGLRQERTFRIHPRDKCRNSRTLGILPSTCGSPDKACRRGAILEESAGHWRCPPAIGIQMASPGGTEGGSFLAFEHNPGLDVQSDPEVAKQVPSNPFRSISRLRKSGFMNLGTFWALAVYRASPLRPEFPESLQGTRFAASTRFAGKNMDSDRHRSTPRPTF